MELPELEAPHCPPFAAWNRAALASLSRHWALVTPGANKPWLMAQGLPPPGPLLFTVFVKRRAQLFAVQCYTCPSLHQEVILSFWDLRDTQRAANPSVLHRSAHFYSQVHKGPWFPSLPCSEMDHDANTCELKQSFTTTYNHWFWYH